MELRERVVKLVKEYYAERGSLPSMRYLARALGVSTKTLYKAFPGGIEEVYEAAGIKQGRVEQAGTLPSECAEFFLLYSEYLKLNGLRESAESICAFIADVREYVRSRLGQAAAAKLAEAPLSTFNKIARMYLEVRRSEAEPS
jgi:AcrR family transcriptional regulator